MDFELDSGMELELKAGEYYVNGHCVIVRSSEHYTHFIYIRKHEQGGFYADALLLRDTIEETVFDSREETVDYICKCINDKCKLQLKTVTLAEITARFSAKHNRKKIVKDKQEEITRFDATHNRPEVPVPGTDKI